MIRGVCPPKPSPPRPSSPRRRGGRKRRNYPKGLFFLALFPSLPWERGVRGVRASEGIPLESFTDSRGGGVGVVRLPERNRRPGLLWQPENPRGGLPRGPVLAWYGEIPMKTHRSGWLALAVLAAMPVVAQQPPAEQPSGVFGEQIEVRVVNVEAVVTDRQGNRVQGLKPSDFRLKVDGKAVPIEYFNEVRGGQAIALDAQETAAVQGLPSLAPGTAVGTSYLVFIDDFFALSARRDEVLRDLKEQLTRLGPEDRMAIVAYDGGRVDMLSSWTGSQRQLGQAIEQAIGRRAFGVGRVAELRSFEASRRIAGVTFEPGPRGAFAQRLDIEEMEYADRLASQTERAVMAA